MRIAKADFLGVWQLHGPIKFNRIRLCVFHREHALAQAGFDGLINQLMRWIEGCRCGLCDVSDPGAPDFLFVHLGHGS